MVGSGQLVRGDVIALEIVLANAIFSLFDTLILSSGSLAVKILLD